MPPPRILYCSFDEFPSNKGAATHINQFVSSLGSHYGSVVLITPGMEDRPIYDYAPGVRHLVLGCPDNNPIGRARTFSLKLQSVLHRQTFDIIQFRSVFEGTAIIPEKQLGTKLIYEINGFPSIEMKYLHRNLIHDTALTDKLHRQEQKCIDAADKILTVSDVSRHNIINRDADHDKIHVIRNGYDQSIFTHRWVWPVSTPVVGTYVGTLTVWQGIEILMLAVKLLRRDCEFQLRFVGPTPKRRLQELQKVANRLGLEDSVTFLGPKSQDDVAVLLRDSHMTFVPLLAIDRNTQQGCCPLKMIEAMGLGVPVIASDLPVVRELATPEDHFLASRPGNPKSIKDAAVEIIENPDETHARSARAAQHVANRFQWSQATSDLIKVYEELLTAF